MIEFIQSFTNNIKINKGRETRYFMDPVTILVFNKLLLLLDFCTIRRSQCVQDSNCSKLYEFYHLLQAPLQGLQLAKLVSQIRVRGWKGFSDRWVPSDYAGLRPSAQVSSSFERANKSAPEAGLLVKRNVTRVKIHRHDKNSIVRFDSSNFVVRIRLPMYSA